MNDVAQILYALAETTPIPGFLHAPFDWSREQAEEVLKRKA